MNRLRDLSPARAWEAMRWRREQREVIRRKVRLLASQKEPTAPELLEEIQRLERTLTVQGRWILGSRDLVPVAILAALLVLWMAQVRTRVPFEVTVSGQLSEFGAAPKESVNVPRLEGVRELLISGLAEVRTSGGERVVAQSIHLDAGDSGRIAVESFPLSVREKVWWRLQQGEMSLAWKSPESANSDADDWVWVDIALSGRVDGEVVSPDRSDVRRISVRLEAGTDVSHRLAWRFRDSASIVRFAPFGVAALDFVREHPGVRDTELVPGWLQGRLDIPSRSEQPFDLEFRETLKLPIASGDIVGLISTPEGWRLRFEGRAQKVFLGSEGLDLSPSLFQHAAAQPEARTALAILTGLGALLAFLRSWVWR